MKFKTQITIAFFFAIHINIQAINALSDSLIIFKQEVIDTDSILESFSKKISSTSTIQNKLPKVSEQPQNKISEIKLTEIYTEKQAFDSILIENKLASENSQNNLILPSKLKPIIIDSLVLNSNPFFIDLVFEKYALNFDWNLKKDFRSLYYGSQSTNLLESLYVPIKSQTPEQFISDLRSSTRNTISRNYADLYLFTFDQLPDPKGYRSDYIENNHNRNVHFVDDNDIDNAKKKKIFVKKEKISPWFHTARGMLQFSQNSVTKNWYQGGSNNTSILGLLSGKVNYDNKENVQWDNNAELRMGFNSIESTVPNRTLQVNDDILKINSKLGIKAGGMWFYSSSIDFSTQFYNSYKSVNSMDLKTSFLTPIRLNVGVGLDFKYKKMVSVMVSPVSYKYIYLDNRSVDSKLFGIEKGEYSLSEVGSSFKAIFSYSPISEIQLDSKLSFYTNYTKMEVDWELVCNFTINRFLSTRVSLNPRYDNTAIMATSEKAELQYKQLLSVGFSHKFL